MTRRKILGAGMKTNNKLNPHMKSGNRTRAKLSGLSVSDQLSPTRNKVNSRKTQKHEAMHHKTKKRLYAPRYFPKLIKKKDQLFFCKKQ